MAVVVKRTYLKSRHFKCGWHCISRQDDPDVEPVRITGQEINCASVVFYDVSDNGQAQPKPFAGIGRASYVSPEKGFKYALAMDLRNTWAVIPNVDLDALVLQQEQRH